MLIPAFFLKRNFVTGKSLLRKTYASNLCSASGAFHGSAYSIAKFTASANKQPGFNFGSSPCVGCGCSVGSLTCGGDAKGTEYSLNSKYAAEG